MSTAPSANPDSRAESSRRLAGILIHTAIDALILGLVMMVVNKQTDRLAEMDRKIQELERRLDQGKGQASS